MQMAQMKRAQAQGETDRGALMQAPNFGAPTAPNMAPTPENAAQLKAPSQFDQASKMVEYLRGKGVSQASMKPYLEQMEKFRPKGKADQQLVKLPDGSLGMINIMDDGSSQVVPYTPAEKQREVNLGDRVGMVGEYTGKQGSSFGMGIGPDAIMRDLTTKRGQNMTDSRMRDQNAITLQGQQQQVVETPNGPILVNKRDATSKPVTTPSGAPVMGDAQMKRQSGAKNVLSLLDEAEQHLQGSTNSFAGAGTDFALRGIGVATPGAQKIAALKTIEGALLSQMPRMEGPQSNYDVQMYKQAAGQLGDPTIPTEVKQIAIDTIRKIQQKYEGGSANNFSAGQVRRYNPATGKIE